MDRRRFVALGVLALPLQASAQANAHVSTTDPLVFSLTKGKAVQPGRVHLELPKLAENGHSVPMSVRVDSLMTAADMFAKLCGVDLSPNRFAEGQVAQTSVARLSAIVIRSDTAGALAFHLLADSAKRANGGDRDDVTFRIGIYFER